MWLEFESTLCLEEFYDGDIPAYAILSHRWGKKEVTFHDMQVGDCTNEEALAKIQGCCRQAGLDGWMYAWIDTCCIDKASSAELSEAINSMFQWYQKAEICYAYLSDIEKHPHPSKPASRRSTTRVEDQAYNLLGLFDVNMAPLYGEGKKAFMRLQLEILAISDDELIFAWRDPSEIGGGLLAHSPEAFRDSAEIVTKESPLATPFTDCSCGYVRHLAHESSAYLSDTKLAPLQCCYEGNTNSDNPYVLAVYLIHNSGNEFSRIDPESIEIIDIRRLDRSPLSHVKTETSPCLDKFEYMENMFVRQNQPINRVLEPYDFCTETKALAELGFTTMTEWLSTTRQTKTTKSEHEIRMQTSQLQPNGMTSIITFTQGTSMERGYLGIHAFVFNITITSRGSLVSLMEVPVHQKQRLLEYEQESFSDRRAPHAKSLLRRLYAGNLVAPILTKVED
ncbi:hypothetical protein BPOR_0435g00120 [Botrytis porri]|uniref:Heterokaryon incompatibility domain-containing protein n=1 Tax=Botrytis porri TaxID=87229 RepID=A0A4Z1KRY5_9HELO|nr:hypothetical protein BPOR_0435g00120 [Botrytis porri]